MNTLKMVATKNAPVQMHQKEPCSAAISQYTFLFFALLYLAERQIDKNAITLIDISLINQLFD